MARPKGTGNGPGIPCPHCGSTTSIRYSEPLTPLIKQFRFDCHDPDCGHTFAGQLAILHSLIPSFRPNPAIDLRVSTAWRRPANDQLAPHGLPAPANDVGERLEA